MTELEQLVEDYYKDIFYILEQKVKWLEPEPEVEAQAKKSKGRLRQMRQFLNEKENKNGKAKK